MVMKHVPFNQQAHYLATNVFLVCGTCLIILFRHVHSKVKSGGPRPGLAESTTSSFPHNLDKTGNVGQAGKSAGTAIFIFLSRTAKKEPG